MLLCSALSWQVNLLIPITYLAFWAFLLVFSLYSEPIVCGVGLIIILTGVPVFFLGVYWRNKPKCVNRLIGKAALCASLPSLLAPNQPGNCLRGLATPPSHGSPWAQAGQALLCFGQLFGTVLGTFNSSQVSVPMHLYCSQQPAPVNTRDVILHTQRLNGQSPRD